MNDKRVEEGSKPIRTAKAVSIGLNILWGLLLVPSVFFGALSGMGSDGLSSQLDSVVYFSILISMYLLMATPLFLLIGVVLSFILRRKARYGWSIGVQFLPVLTIILAVILELGTLFR